ncbi:MULTISPECIES: CinA family protein [unclassified Nitratiruptor]|uniref:CinA family protein n=1 Tax=unclassified Nitratiruptor TaxID=2624044 RepID=UPI001914E5D5|nr:MULTISPECIES: CinA family protein [unclassified Nitratiruptor]BCD60596.1 nicotinamide-nucleotide amidase [Nitratiruptor sp. YY08-10]BCD64527.1 nicotinamide-nucleotide amidase [Nitratiruptor sp. YY08-14]
MKNAILFIGQDFLINDAFVASIERTMYKQFINIHAKEFFHDKDKDLILHVSKTIENFDTILIATTSQSFPIVSKILSTLYEDNLIAKEGMLVPSKVSEIEKDSYILYAQDKQINVIQAEVCKKVPKILLENGIESAILHIFDLEYEEFIEKLSPLARTFEIEIQTTKLTHNLYKILAINKKFGDLPMFVQNAKLLFPNNMIIAHNLFEYLIDRFTIAHKKITFAESCTGGLLASMLTKIPGASNIFDGSLVTYANEIKHAWLGVRNETLMKYGAVSHETVEEMIEGALKSSESDYAIAISGIAGPGGGSKEKPVGTVFVGCGDTNQSIIHKMHFEGDRNYVQYQAAMYGVKLLFEIASDDLF